MVSHKLLKQAAKRTGYRPELLSAPIVLIIRRHRKGHTPGQIAAFLRDWYGADNLITDQAFVDWVLTHAGRR